MRRWSIQVATCPTTLGRGVVSGGTSPVEGGVPSPTERLPSPSAVAPLRATAVVVRGPNRGESLGLRGAPIRVGSGSGCDLQLTDDAVSAAHVALSLQGANVLVRDLDSTNGTFVGSHGVKAALVPLGSVVRLGRTSLHLRGEDHTLVLDPHPEDHFGELHGGSVTMRTLYALLRRVATTDASLFVDGETGTGKELVANALHAHSSRREHPLLVLDCSSIAPTLVGSQLFGHVRGAFTGAQRDRAGIFEEARGGTVFLDEIDSLPLDLQAQLLRVLATHEVVRLGEVRARPVDFRIVAASRVRPEDLVATGAMREDLYFRLTVVRMTLPRLADRLEDLPGLVRVLLDRMEAGHVRVTEGPAMDRLRGHGWPGNVRELRNTLERALALAAADADTLDALPIVLGPMAPATAVPVGEIHLGLPYKEAKARVVADWERRFLAETYARCDHNLSATARTLELSRTHLRKLLREHGIVS